MLKNECNAMQCNVTSQLNENNENEHYSAIATTAAPPIIAKNSRFRFVVAPDESVCRPGATDVFVDAAVGCTTVNMVTVLGSPLAMVVVLLYVEVYGVVF